MTQIDADDLIRDFARGLTPRQLATKYACSPRDITNAIDVMIAEQAKPFAIKREAAKIVSTLNLAIEIAFERYRAGSASEGLWLARYASTLAELRGLKPAQSLVAALITTEPERDPLLQRLETAALNAPEHRKQLAKKFPALFPEWSQNDDEPHTN
jgi:hypothetical protein